jgi:hypothetical protein
LGRHIAGKRLHCHRVGVYPAAQASRSSRITRYGARSQDIHFERRKVVAIVQVATTSAMVVLEEIDDRAHSYSSRRKTVVPRSGVALLLP